MSVSQRGDGRFVVKFKLDGRWKQRSFRTREQAEAFDDECAYDEQKDTRPTLLEVVLAFVRSVPHVDKTVAKYRYTMLGNAQRQAPAGHLADRYVDTLTRRDLESVRERCRADGMQAATINVYTGKLQAALNWAAEQDLIRENPWAKYHKLREQPQSWTGELEDFRRVYDSLPTWMQWACRTAMALCLRPGIAELFSLRWSAFDWRQKRVRVMMPKVGRAKEVFPPDGYLAEAWERFQADTAEGYELVCRSRKNRQVYRDDVYRRPWVAACEKVGVKMPFYAIRHIATSQMLAGGADLAAVSAQLGHKSLATTAGIYAHAVQGAQKKAASTLAEMVQPLVQVGAKLPA